MVQNSEPEFDIITTEAGVELSIDGVTSPVEGDNMLDIATKAINDIRERAGADLLTGSLAADEDSRNQVRRERRKELAFEHKSKWDIRRWRVQHAEGRDGFWGEKRDASRFGNGESYRLLGLYPFYHFELCKIFGGVPIVDRTLTVADSKKLVRASEAETAAFIIDELKAIADDGSLPSKMMLPSAELGRVTCEAVWAMQTKVYMYFAKDDESLCKDAADAAKRVVDSENFGLEPDFQELYRANGYLSRESIFVNIRGDMPAEYIYGSFLPCYASPRSSGAYGFDQPTQSLVDEFEEGDPRLLYTIIQPGDRFPTDSGTETLNFSTYPNTGYHSRKVFLIQSRRGPGWGDDAWSFHHIRYADILLLYAEALLYSFSMVVLQMRGRSLI